MMAQQGRADVPDLWKAPDGPYHRAPKEYGGLWWLVSPFTGEEPWLAAVTPVAGDEIPEGFEDIFGPRPTHRTHPDPAARRLALADWKQSLKHFQGVGIPEGLGEDEIAAANRVYAAWGLGRLRLFRGRYGWMGAFPDAEVDYRTDAETAVRFAHQVVARWQLKRIQMGEAIDKNDLHPFVSPDLFR